MQFSKDYDALIHQFVGLGKGQTDEAIAGYVVFHAGQDLPGETHTREEVLERVKLLRSRGGQRQGPGPRDQPPSSGSALPATIDLQPLGTHRDSFGRSIATGQSAFARWRQSWNQLINTASTTTQSILGSVRTSATGSLGTAIGVARSTYTGAGSGVATMVNRVRSAATLAGTQVRGASSNLLTRIQARRARNHAAFVTGRANRARRSGNPWSWLGSSWARAATTIHRGALGGQFAYLMPNTIGSAGRTGGIVGSGVGGAFGGPLGSIVGQAAGTVIGNFVDKMKDAVTQAHAFAVALKESNSRFIYYNSSIMMSYVQSDLATLMRDMRVARAIAPSAISLNRSITSYQAVNTSRDIFLGNMSNEWAQMKLAPGQILSESMQPFWRGAEMIRQYFSPQGNAGGTWTGSVLRTVRNSIYGSIGAFIPGVGPLSAIFGMPWLRDAIDKFLNPDKGMTEQLNKGAWDNFLGSPGTFFVEPGTAPEVPPDGVMTRRIRNRLDRF